MKSSSVTGTTYAEFEPALDYVVAKIPRWPFDKFPRADRRLGTQMRATGEVMAIGRNAEEAIQKAISDSRESMKRILSTSRSFSVMPVTMWIEQAFPRTR